jgi:hypothetical protein
MVVRGKTWLWFLLAACSGQVTQAPSDAALASADSALAIDAANADGAVLADADADAASECDAYRELFGLNVSFADPLYLDDASALGAKWLRVEVRHPLLSYDHYRDVAQQAHARGLKVLFLLGYSLSPGKPAWHASDAEWDAYRAAFRVDLEGAASELGAHGDAFEVWNEPDHELSSGYDPGVPSHQFGLLLSEASVILRSHSNAPLVIGGVATKNYAYITEARAAAGGILDYDGLGVHTYGPPSFTPAIVRSELDQILTAWHNASGLPLWLTEAGAVATPAAEQHAVTYLNTLYNHIWDHHSDKVVSIHYFSWSDAVGFAHERFGLVRLDGSHKPSFGAYQTLAAGCVD